MGKYKKKYDLPTKYDCSLVLRENILTVFLYEIICSFYVDY